MGGQLSDMWFVYVLKSLKDGKYYIGSTSDLKKRILQHNRGSNTSTKHRRPLELVYSGTYNTEEEAVARAFQIKRYKGGQAFKKLIK